MLVPQLLANGVVAGCAYALLALGFGLIYNATRIFHIAHGAVFVLAAYVFYATHTLWEWPVPLSVLATVTLSTVFGVFLDRVVYRPLDAQDASLSVHLLSSLGVYIVVVNLIGLAFGNQTQVLDPGVQQTIQWGGLVLTEIQVATAVVFVVLFVALAVGIRRTAWRRRVRALRDDPALVATVGVDPLGVRLVVFAVGSALAAVAAVLIGLDLGIDPQMGMSAVLTAAVAVIVGGVGVFEGAALGGVLLGLVRSLAVWQTSARWEEAVTFSVLIVFLLARPEGLLGRRRRAEETLT